jgi:hypothetical protein
VQLSDLIGESATSHPTTTTATIRGKPVTLRLTSALTQARIEETLSRPRPPMVQDPNKGSLAPKVPDTSDPAWLEAMEHRARKLQIVEVAIAMDFEVPTPGDPLEGTRRWSDCQSTFEREAWATEAINVLGSTLTRGEVVLLINTLADGLVRLLPQEALGN